MQQSRGCSMNKSYIVTWIWGGISRKSLQVEKSLLHDGHCPYFIASSSTRSEFGEHGFLKLKLEPQHFIPEKLLCYLRRISFAQVDEGTWDLPKANNEQPERSQGSSASHSGSVDLPSRELALIRRVKVYGTHQDPTASSPSRRKQEPQNSIPDTLSWYLQRVSIDQADEGIGDLPRAKREQPEQVLSSKVKTRAASIHTTSTDAMLMKMGGPLWGLLN
ncbi:hypothetical protein VTL71DRAFT_14880 [Oculimacula yallundae]|uniref:Uncharacterized protein n=1 Tax=Oculimacula yallundae TaxID=86028 RepID=A0ABR4CH83_9HELO